MAIHFAYTQKIMPYKSLKSKLVLFLKGLAMGGMDIIPGVSGGTMALILGIYPDLVLSLHNVKPMALVHLARGQWQLAKQELSAINLHFLLPLGAALLLAPFLMAHLIFHVLDTYPGYLYGFFFGLIVGSALLIFKKLPRHTLGSVCCMLVGALITYVITGFTGNIQLPHSFPYIFLCGMISINAMILPGISGAFFSYIMGQYSYMIEATRTLNLLVLGSFALGASIGLMTFSRLASYMLKHHELHMLSFLIGLMLGSLRLPLIHIYVNDLVWWHSVGAGLLALGLIASIEYIRKRADAAIT